MQGSRVNVSCHRRILIQGGSASSPIDSGNSNLNSYDWNNRDEFDDKSSGMGGLNGYDNWSGKDYDSSGRSDWNSRMMNDGNEDNDDKPGGGGGRGYSLNDLAMSGLLNDKLTDGADLASAADMADAES